MNTIIMMLIELAKKYTIKIIGVLVIAVLCLFGLLWWQQTTINNANKVIDRYRINQEIGDSVTTIYKNKLGYVTASSIMKDYTIAELKRNNNLQIKELKDNAIAQGAKIKRLEAIISAQLSGKIDTVTIVHTDTINDTTFVQIDSLTVGSFHLVRKLIIGDTIAKYNILYTPKLYVTIERFKYGKWTIRNILKPREIRYKAYVSSDDKFLSPTEVIAIKTVK